MVIELKLGLSGKVALVSDEDADKVTGVNWNLQSKGYVIGCIKGKIRLLHRHLLGVTDPTIDVDHIDDDPLNNQRDNIRCVTTQQNSSRSRKWRSPTSSRFKGVAWDKKNNKWEVRITLNYKKQFLGRFDDEHEAARAYDNAAKALFGEFRRPNLPEEQHGNSDVEHPESRQP